MLRPQDVVVLLKLVASPESFTTYPALAAEVGLGLSETHRSLERAAQSRLYDADRRRPVMARLREFVIHGVPYAFPAERGAVTRGLATGYAAPPLRAHFRTLDAPPEQIPVWPYVAGTDKGYQLTPLYPSVPEAAMRDPGLYALLALVDALREGRARERNLATAELEARLKN